MSRLGGLPKDQQLFINDVRFTEREFDVISCILHCRGSKKIADFLSISPRTAESHIHNIMLKLGSHARDGIIDFVEKSDQFSSVKQHYTLLLKESLFKKQLQSIARKPNHPRPTCVLCHEARNSLQSKFFKCLKGYLILAGVKVKGEADVFPEAEGKEIYIVSSDSSTKIAAPSRRQIHLLLPGKDSNSEAVSGQGSELIDFREDAAYYHRFLEFLSKLIPDLDVKAHQITLETPVEKTESESFGEKQQGEADRWAVLFKTLLSLGDKNGAKIPALVLASVGVIFLTVALRYSGSGSSVSSQGSEIIYTRPNKALPEGPLALSRSKLLVQIGRRMASQKKGIRVIALVGPGGAGKTTVAHRYGNLKNIQLIWEINAQTSKTLIHSFESLAHALAHSSEDKNELAIILRTEQAAIREEYILSFVRKRLKNQKEWLLIYDNVESFADVQEKLPHDSKIWGRGQVIITTQDSNAGSSNYIGSDNVISVGILSTAEKKKIFLEILKDNSVEAGRDDLSLEAFLEQIPPFPLDISLAAYYLLNSSMTFSDYLRFVGQEEFANNQRCVLENVCEYTKTRHGIITLSLQKIISVNSAFKDLLFLVSLVDSGNIPVGLLRQHTDQIGVDHFLHQMLKYSLVTVDKKKSKTLTIHRSIQNMMRRYLTGKFKPQPDSPVVLTLAKTVTDYMQSLSHSLEMVKMKDVLPHIKQFQKNLALSDQKQGQILGEIGRLCYYLGDYDQAERKLKNALKLSKKTYGRKHTQTAWIQLYLAKVYRNLGYYTRAKRLMKKSLAVYEKDISKNPLKVAWAATHLGNVYRSLGLHDKALSLLRQSLALYKSHYGEKHIKSVWASVHLGNVYKAKRDYKKANEILEKAYPIFLSHYGADHISTTWVHICLAETYLRLGLAVPNAEKFYAHYLKIYENYYGKEHIQTAWVLRRIGRACYFMNDFEQSERLLNRSLKVLKNLNHPDQYQSLISLANLYLKKSENHKARHRSQQAESYKKKALETLQKTIVVVEENFSHNSPYLDALNTKVDAVSSSKA